MDKTLALTQPKATGSTRFQTRQAFESADRLTSKSRDASRMLRSFLLVLAVGLSLPWLLCCSSEQTPSGEESNVSEGPAQTAAAADASDVPDSSDTSDGSSTFHGYDCTQDCSGHKAGYEWAKEHGIDDPDKCGGDSESFKQGCRAYAEEQDEDSEAKDD
jgi:hypothetical protein